MPLEYKRLDNNDLPQDEAININEVYYPHLTGWQRVGRFFTRRAAWCGVSIFSLSATVPLLCKSAVNFVVGLFRNTIGAIWYGGFNKEYFVATGKGLIGVLMCIGIGIGSLFGIIKPSIPGYFVKQQILQSPRRIREKVKAKRNKKLKVNPSVKAGDEEIDTVDFPVAEKNARWQIVFLPNADIYQESYQGYLCSQLVSSKFRYHSRIFNYPGVTIYQGRAVLDKPNGIFDSIQKKWRQEFPESVVELISAGVAQIYELKVKQGWSWEQVVEQVNLYGHSLGGGIAAQVRAHFIEHHNVYLKTFIDRSFSSLKAVGMSYANQYLHLPAWFSGPISSMALHGAGGWELDTLGSLKKYGDKNVDYINLFLRPKEKHPSLWVQIKQFFGLGEKPDSADEIIFDDATLMHGVEEAKAESTHAQVARLTLATKGHQFYFQPDGADENRCAHNAILSRLIYAKDASTDAATCYAHWVNRGRNVGSSSGDEVGISDYLPCDRRSSDAIVRPPVSSL